MALPKSVCDNCVNTECLWRAPTGGNDPPVMICPHKIEKPHTNYDLLVSKTPEELAKTIVGWLADAAELCGENRQEFDIPKAEEYTVSWLKSPAEEE